MPLQFNPDGSIQLVVNEVNSPSVLTPTPGTHLQATQITAAQHYMTTQFMTAQQGFDSLHLYNNVEPLGLASLIDEMPEIPKEAVVKTSAPIIDQTISQVFPKVKNKNGAVGIEIEAEGKLKYTECPKQKWQLKEEHSLRNGGIELATNVPHSIDNIQEVIDQYKLIMSGSDFDLTSWRTSIHLHINVQKFTVRQLFSIIMAYWMFEDIFCRLNGAGREGNLHCLRLRDADGLYMALRNDINSGNFLSQVTKHEYRYAAMNLASLQKFGSVEFRFLKFPDNLDDITIWAKALHKLVHVAATKSWDEVISYYTQDIAETIKTFLPKEFWPWLNQLDQRFIENTIRQHLEYAEMLRVCLEYGARSLKSNFGTETWQDTNNPDETPTIFRDLNTIQDEMNTIAETYNSQSTYGWSAPPPEYDEDANGVWFTKGMHGKKSYWHSWYVKENQKLQGEYLLAAEQQPTTPDEYGEDLYLDEPAEMGD